MAACGRRSFEQESPELARKLHSLLGAKRVPASKREDIVQETGLRLFRMWDHVDPARPVWALTVTIALNLVRDDARRRSTSEVLGTVPDIASSYDVERSGLARLELARVERALNQMTPAHRSVLLAEVGDEMSPTRGANAVKMLRMRARRRLTTLLDSASAGAVVAGVKIRKLFRLEQAPLALKAPTDQGHELAHAAAGVAAAVAMFSLIPQGLAPPKAHARPPAAHGGVADVAISLPDMSAADLVAGAFGRPGGIVEDGGRFVARPQLRDGASALGERPRNLRIGMGGGDYVEGSAQVAALGFGAKVEDRKEEPPVCVSGASIGPNPVDCGDGATAADQDGAGLGLGFHGRVKFGRLEVTISHDDGN